jgi:hypothetical protein
MFFHNSATLVSYAGCELRVFLSHMGGLEEVAREERGGHLAPLGVHEALFCIGHDLFAKEGALKETYPSTTRSLAWRSS